MLQTDSPFAPCSIAMEEAAQGFAVLDQAGGTVQDFLEGIEDLRRMPPQYPWHVHTGTTISTDNLIP